MSKIDPKIKGIVRALNKLDIPTTGSCQGHPRYGHPAPWVKITPKKESQNVRPRKLVSKYLSEFYKGRRVKKDVRIVIEKANVGFWIHNGGKDYKKSRKEMMKRVRLREAGKIVPHQAFSLKEISKRKKTLPIYQEEMKNFGLFLEKKAKS